MESHPYDSSYSVSDQQKQQFARDGFVKLPGFLNQAVVAMLLERCDNEQSERNNFKSEFKRIHYDFEAQRHEVYCLIEQPYFQRAMADLTGRDLFMTHEICFELEKGVSEGFPWHVGVQSFGYQVGKEFGCTIWAPLHRIRTDDQHGGLAYVPQHVVSGGFIFDQIEPAIVSTLEEKQRRGIDIKVEDYFSMRVGLLNSPTMADLLEMHALEDDFEPGDVLLFNKYVVHRSKMLNEGPMSRRTAFVMRFVDSKSHYDLQRAKNLEYPNSKFGHKLVTHSHMEINLPDGALLSESPYFDNLQRRMIRCQ